MSHTIPIPDDLYEQISAQAEQSGQTIEELVAAWIRERTAATTPPPTSDTPFEDPIAEFIGAFSFGVGDLAELHDHYLAEEAHDIPRTSYPLPHSARRSS